MNKLIVDYTLSDKQSFDLVYCFSDMCFYNILLQDIQQYLNGLYPMFSVYIENVEEQVDGEVTSVDYNTVPRVKQYDEYSDTEHEQEGDYIQGDNITY